jgi:hypothetical protein
VFIRLKEAGLRPSEYEARPFHVIGVLGCDIEWLTGVEQAEVAIVDSERRENGETGDPQFVSLRKCFTLEEVNVQGLDFVLRFPFFTTVGLVYSRDNNIVKRLSILAIFLDIF